MVVLGQPRIHEANWSGKVGHGYGEGTRVRLSTRSILFLSFLLVLLTGRIENMGGAGNLPAAE